MNMNKFYLQFKERRGEISREILKDLKNPISEELKMKLESVKAEEKELMKNDEYVYSMFKCEMNNSDYFSGESDDLVLSNYGLPDDILWKGERLNKIYLKVRKDYMEIMEEYYG